MENWRVNDSHTRVLVTSGDVGVRGSESDAVCDHWLSTWHERVSWLPHHSIRCCRAAQLSRTLSHSAQHWRHRHQVSASAFSPPGCRPSGLYVLLPFLIYLFNSSVNVGPVVSKCTGMTVAKFSALVELWLWIINFELVFRSLWGDVAMASNSFIHGTDCSWRQASSGAKEWRQVVKILT